MHSRSWLLAVNHFFANQIGTGAIEWQGSYPSTLKPWYLGQPIIAGGKQFSKGSHLPGFAAGPPCHPREWHSTMLTLPYSRSCTSSHDKVQQEATVIQGWEESVLEVADFVKVVLWMEEANCLVPFSDFSKCDWTSTQIHLQSCHQEDSLLFQARDTSY